MYIIPLVWQIDGMPYEGGVTNIVAGLVKARTEVLAQTTEPNANRPQYQDIVVLLSDGGDNVNKEEV